MNDAHVYPDVEESFVQVVLLMPNMPAFKATIPNDYAFFRQMVNVGKEEGHRSGGLEHVTDSITYMIRENMSVEKMDVSILLNEEGKLIHLKPTKRIFIDDDIYFANDVLFGVGIVHQLDYHGNVISYDNDVADKIIAAYNRNERDVEQDLNPEDFIRMEIY